MYHWILYAIQAFISKIKDSERKGLSSQFVSREVCYEEKNDKNNVNFLSCIFGHDRLVLSRISTSVSNADGVGGTECTVYDSWAESERAGIFTLSDTLYNL
jgi:hypothetical protein